jgi:PEP-CTERM motif
MRISVFCVALALVASSVSADVVYENGMGSNADWTEVKPTSVWSTGWYNKTDPVWVKARIRSNGEPSTDPVNRFGAVYKTAPLAASGDYNPTLASSTSPLEWSFSMSDGFSRNEGTVYSGNPTNGGKYVSGWIVAASSSSFRTDGDGYGVAMAQAPDDSGNSSLTFFKYTGGLDGTVTELIDWSAADGSETGLHAIGSGQVQVRLGYAPGTNQWTLQGRRGDSSGYGSAFDDPLAVTYGANDTKSIVDSSYTSSSLDQLGVFVSSDETSIQFYFGNFVLQTVPEPTTMGLLAMSGLALLKRRR